MLSLPILFLCAQAQPSFEPGMVLDVGVALTMEERKVIHNARILVGADGLLQEVGRQADIAAPEGWEHLRYPNATAWPGGIDLHSHTQTGGWGDINDMVHPGNPELRTLDTIVADNHLHQLGRAGGVTLVNAIPGSGTNLSGAGTLIKLRSRDTVEGVVFKYPGSVKVAQGYNPERGDDLGATRMGMWWMLRWYLDRAEVVEESTPVLEQKELASISQIFEGHHPFLVHTAGARDTYGTIRMFQLEAGVPVVVSHASFHGYMAGEEIAATGAGLNVGPRNYDFSFNRQSRFVGLVEAYERTGNTDISVQTDAGVIPQEEFVYQATLAERFGCTTWTALESLNVDAAHQILVEDQVGRLLPGMQADIVVSTGQPLDPRSAVELVIVEGEIAYDRRDGMLY